MHTHARTSICISDFMHKLVSRLNFHHFSLPMCMCCVEWYVIDINSINWFMWLFLSATNEIASVVAVVFYYIPYFCRVLFSIQLLELLASKWMNEWNGEARNPGKESDTIVCSKIHLEPILAYSVRFVSFVFSLMACICFSFILPLTDSHGAQIK